MWRGHREQRFARAGGFDASALRNKSTMQEAFPIATRDGQSSFLPAAPSTNSMQPNTRAPSSNIEHIDYTLEHGRRRTKRPLNDEDDYFDDPETEPSSNAPPPAAPDDDDDDDPLDAFMAAIDKQAKRDHDSVDVKKSTTVYRADVDEPDLQESYYKYMAENPTAGVGNDGDLDEAAAAIEYDRDGRPIAPERSRHIEPLPPIDHSAIEYRPFERNFYTEHEEIKQLSLARVAELRMKLGVRVTGASIPRPVCSFAHFGFDDRLVEAIRKSDYTQPTPIQSQAIPAALQGRDVLGIAKTGSGKTAAYLWPMLSHVLDQAEPRAGEGAIALILAPTRELAQQIYAEAKRFGARVYNMSIGCVFGGAGKYEQSRMLKEQSPEVLVATPGRLIDMIKMGVTDLRRCTYLVLDEADRMFDLGFEPQVRSVCRHVRPDRQTLLFSATFRKRIEKLARDSMSDPIRIVQGGGTGTSTGEASDDVQQYAYVFGAKGKAPQEKWQWLLRNLIAFESAGQVLLFVTRRLGSEELAGRLRDHFGQTTTTGASGKSHVELLHGDLDQTERQRVLGLFRRGETPLLVATDVAARGLDIPQIRTVINYDVARDIDTHIHRIGRTGRAGVQGQAYTLLDPDRDKEFAGHLVRQLECVNQCVPESLVSLAMQSQSFRKSRFRQQGDSKRPMRLGGRGLGYRAPEGGGGGGGSSRSVAQPSTISTSDMVKEARYQAKSLAKDAAAVESTSSAAAPQQSSGFRAALQARFQMNFRSATSADTGSAAVQVATATPATAQQTDARKRPRKSRWGD